MSWNNMDESDSENEMFQMTSARLQDDNSHVRLLSVSDDDDLPEVSPRNAGLPQLHFRENNRAPSSWRKDEKKSRTAVVSILIIGLTLIIIINIGLGIKLKSMDDEERLSSAIFADKCLTPKPQDELKCERSFPWHKFRLPDAIHPEHYMLFLHPNLTQGSYSGSVDITISIKKETDKIIFHSRDLILKNITVFKVSSRSTAGSVIHLEKNYTFCKNLDFVALPLSQNLIESQQYIIHVEFDGNLAESLRGFYLSKYKTKSGENRTIATTQFESTDARAAFPCFDEPALKANFTLSMVRDKGFSTLSNMPIKATSSYDTDLELDEFETTFPMSTYLLAFIISDFEAISQTIHLLNGPLNVSVYAPSDKINTANLALNISCEVMKFYEKAFKVPYPLPKLDLVAIPDFEAGAMENWGLVTYRETAVLWNENTSSIHDQERVALVIAHEFAHQWFGNLVTMKWWNDLWLNEGFASYMEYYAVDRLKQEWHFMEQFPSEHTFYAVHVDESVYTHPISVPVNSKAQIEELFDDISYSKGACVIAMVIDYLGEKEFLSGVSDYLKKYAYSNTENMDLVRSVAAKSSSNQQQVNVLDMLKSWTNEPGLPIINVSLSATEVTLSQNRYLLSVGNEGDPCVTHPKKPLWHVPVSYISDKLTTKGWEFLENRTVTFSLQKNPKWLILNTKRGGYYIVNYSKDLLSALATQFKDNHEFVTPEDRAGVIYNVAKSAQAGYNTYDDLLELISYLKKEEDFSPIEVASDVLLMILKFFQMQYDTESYGKMKSFYGKLFQHLYEEYGWPSGNSRSSENDLTHPEIKLRKTVVGVMCTVNDKDCTSTALKKFDAWRYNGTEVHPDYRTVVYSTGVRLGSPSNWDFLWNKYTEDLTIDAHEKKKLLSALCRTTEEKKIFFLLDESIKGERIRFQDSRSVLAYLRSTRIGSYMTWKFIRSKWSELEKIYPLGSSPNRAMFNIFYSFMDDGDISSAEQFIRSHNLTELRYVKRALDHAKLNVHWVKTYQPQVVKWLNENLDGV